MRGPTPTRALAVAALAGTALADARYMPEGGGAALGTLTRELAVAALAGAAGTPTRELTVAALAGAALAGAHYMPEGGWVALGVSTLAPFEGSLPLLSHPSAHCPNTSIGSPMPQC